MNDPVLTTPSSTPLMKTLPLADPITRNNMLIVGLEANKYMQKHEESMKNGMYDTRFIDHNDKIVTRMDVKDSVRLYCLREQSHKESEIEYMTLKQFKANTWPKRLSHLNDTNILDAIYFNSHEFNESYYKVLYTPSTVTHIKN